MITERTRIFTKSYRSYGLEADFNGHCAIAVISNQTYGPPIQPVIFQERFLGWYRIMENTQQSPLQGYNAGVYSSACESEMAIHGLARAVLMARDDSSKFGRASDYMLEDELRACLNGLVGSFLFFEGADDLAGSISTKAVLFANTPLRSQVDQLINQYSLYHADITEKCEEIVGFSRFGRRWNRKNL